MYCASCEVRAEFICYVEESRPPLWSSGQSSWLRDQEVWVRFPTLLDFLGSSKYKYNQFLHTKIMRWRMPSQFSTQRLCAEECRLNSPHKDYALKNAVFWDVAGSASCKNWRFGGAVASIVRIEKTGERKKCQTFANRLQQIELVSVSGDRIALGPTK
jgi:hypothetical protein